MTETVLVLGAGGTVGRAILAAIQAQPDLCAVAGLRRPPLQPSPAGAPAAEPAPVEIRLADATDARSLRAALAGCAFAVNAVGGPPATLRAATRALCLAAPGTALRRLVHVSSMAIYGGGATGLVREDAPFAAAPTAYEAAKIDCEAEVQAYAAAGHAAVILRPGIVFGPGSTQWADRIARLLRAQRLGDLGSAGDGFCNLTHAADLGAWAVAALNVPEAPGRAFNLATLYPPTWNDFLIRFARALGATPVRRITPRWLAAEARLFAPALQAARIAAGRAGLRQGLVADPIPPSLIRLFGQRMRLDTALAERFLPIVRTPDAEAIRDTAAVLNR